MSLEPYTPLASYDIDIVDLDGSVRLTLLRRGSVNRPRRRKAELEGAQPAVAGG